MNLIIELIIKIFQAVFEEDRRRRVPPLADETDGRQADRGGERSQRGTKTMEEWLQGVLDPQPPPVPPEHSHRGREGAIPPVFAPRPPASRARPSRPKPKPQPVRKAPPGPVTEPPVASRSMPTIAKKAGFRLPGATPLARLMYGQIILGPCKAKSRSRRSG